MKEELIKSYTAILAKEKGFKPESPSTEYVNGFTEQWDEESDTIIGYKENTIQEEDYVRQGYYLRPTQTVLQRWLREVHNIDVFAFSVRFTGYLEIGFYTFSVKGITPTKNYRYDNYEDALEAGLIEGLNLL